MNDNEPLFAEVQRQLETERYTAIAAWVGGVIVIVLAFAWLGWLSGVFTTFCFMCGVISARISR
jgi:hypothetical protein